MRPRICVPLPAENPSNLDSMIRRAEDASADLIEVRLDYMGPVASNTVGKLEGIVKQASVPLIATNREYRQGGHCRQDEKDRVQTLIMAAEAGFQYVDLELTSEALRPLVEKVKDHGARPIVSLHDLEGTPAASEMEKTVNSEIEAGAEICKLVTTANDVEDNIKCLLLTRRMSESTKIVCFAMGSKGLVSRVLSPVFGGYFTFASLEGGAETAPGQMSIADLRELYRKLGVNG